MRHFELSCACGDLWTKGDGNSKKRAKKRAAQLMLAELRGLPALPPAPAAAAGATGGRPKKPPPKKKKQSNIIKVSWRSEGGRNHALRTVRRVPGPRACNVNDYRFCGRSSVEM